MAPKKRSSAKKAKNGTKFPTSRFSRLKKVISQKDTKVVLSLGGGGIRMFGHPAALTFLEQIGVQKYISEIWGASGGALIGFLYSRGVTPDEMEKKGMEVYHSQETGLVPSSLSIARKLIVEKFFPKFGKEPRIRGFQDCQETLHKMVSDTLKMSKKGEKYPVFCLAFNVQENRTEVLTSHKIPSEVYKGFIFQSDPLDAIIASCAIPILFLPKVIKDKTGKRMYADGAMVEDVPSTSVYKKWLRDKELGIEKRKNLLLITVNLNPYFRALGFLDNWLLQNLPGFDYLLLASHYADVMRQARTQEQKRALFDDPNVEIWDLFLEMPEGGLMNVNLIPKVIKVAKTSLPRQFQEINDSLLV